MPKKKKRVRVETEEERRIRLHREHEEGTRTNNITCLVALLLFAAIVIAAEILNIPLP